ncbi:MAG TPA: cytochrome d ubiquinol oxidase subunit II [Pseudonocardiaceae bacterium]|jgi:cytochrome d ubiquinol oxidase subunit II|nr:cytochrome d ubiquinol oxidase subunit II [Pseudonocardiaceae bacterium]
MDLQDLWFIAIALLWTGYFFLEGFGFGVGMLLSVLGRDEDERRALISTIGPVWDGNEVWLIVAAGATFASFPLWYATLFSGFYLPLLVILVALILRGVAFEYRGKVDSTRWRTNWDRAILFGSVVPAVLWGFVFGNIIRGVPVNADFDYAGGVWNLLNIYSLVGGLTTLTLFLLHGALFIALKTAGDIEVRGRQVAERVGLAAVVLTAVFLVWTQVERGKTPTAVTALLGGAALLSALVVNRVGRERWAFALSGATIALVTATFFVALYPDVLPSTNPAYSLTVDNARSTDYTLTILTWVAVIFLPLVLAYQAWTYWVFRQRITVRGGPDQVRSPPDAGAGTGQRDRRRRIARTR